MGRKTPDTEIDFDAVMQSHGVSRRAEKRSKAKSRPRVDGSKDGETAHPPSRGTTHQAEAVPKVAPDPQERKDGETERAMAEAEASIRAQLTENERINGQLAATEMKLESVRGERNALAAKLRSLEQGIAEHQKRSVTAVLKRAGCQNEHEIRRALSSLLETFPKQVIGALDPVSSDAFEELIERSLFLVCKAPECQLRSKVVVVHVSRPRCEMCGGSSIQSAFRVWLDICARHGVKRVTIVGGSPAYHQALEELIDSLKPNMKLSLVNGTRARNKKRVQADMRGSDLVIIWGATMLKHSTTQNYKGGPAKVTRVTHRGIAGMLRRSGEMLNQA